ncbi:PilZ domain-containing protein [Celerinatantimonas yamalensis]|uniref:PilZ domain-containing protein n=1 Tax=Celerinatantimonas yamalensis TaxID=559956 RepID=A0ABW9G489_9GAMM
MNDETSYFSVSYQLNLNIKPLPIGTELPDYEQFLNAIPESFRLAASNQNRVSDIGTSLSALGEAGVALQRYLKAQADKLDMILTYMLSLQDEVAARTQSTHFGGSQIRFHWPTTLEVGQLVEMKIFLSDEATAIYCYARVIDVINNEPFNIACEYALIREEDCESLVRASLHIQSKLLQARANARQQHD